MTSRKFTTRFLRSLCAEAGPEDGVDPRLQAAGNRQRSSGRKTHQLCSQVADTLGDLLAGQGGDDVLRSLFVVSVAPAPDASRLLVTVGAQPGEGLDPVEVIEHLHRASARLRCEVSAAITRKRAPTLVYRFAVPASPAD
jgi:ribosome-binding factor A